jgi:hypothetical protein
MKDPYEVAGEQLGERMPRLIAKYQTELVAMQAVFTDPLARIAKDRALVEVFDALHKMLKESEKRGEIKDLTIAQSARDAAENRLALFDKFDTEKHLNDAILKLQEAVGALEDLAQLYPKLAAELKR